MIAAIVFSTMIIGAGLIVYMLGLAVHPHRVGFASIVAGLYVVLCGSGYWFAYRAQMAAARRT